MPATSVKQQRLMQIAEHHPDEVYAKKRQRARHEPLAASRFQFWNREGQADAGRQEEVIGMTYEKIFKQARALLNDPDAEVFTDEVLAPLVLLAESRLPFLLASYAAASRQSFEMAKHFADEASSLTPTTNFKEVK